MAKKKRAAPVRPVAAAPPPLPAEPGAPPRRSPWWLLGLLMLVAAGVALWALRPAPPAPVASSAPTAAPPAAAAEYVANAQCLSCHQDAAKAWAGSHHAHAMAPATDQTVAGNFDNTQFRHQGVTTRFFKRDGKFFVHTDGPDGKLGDFEVKYSFGVAPLQQYLIETEGGRLQPLQIAWNTEERKWFHLLPQEKAPPGDVLHWTGRYQTANTMCISCHTTGFEKRYDAAADRFDSRWREVNVSCQSCHGPGSTHAAWAAANPGAASAPTGQLADLKTPRA